MEKISRDKVLAFCMGSHARLGAESLIPKEMTGSEDLLNFIGQMVIRDAERRAEVEKQLSPFVLSSNKEEIVEKMLDIIADDKLLLARRIGHHPSEAADAAAASAPQQRLCDLVWDIRKEVQARIEERMVTCSWKEPIMMEHSVSFELLGRNPMIRTLGNGCFTPVYEGWEYDVQDHVDDLVEGVRACLSDAEEDKNDDWQVLEGIVDMLILQACVFPIVVPSGKLSVVDRSVQMISVRGEANIRMCLLHEFQERLDLLYMFEDVDSLSEEDDNEEEEGVRYVDNATHHGGGDHVHKNTGRRRGVCIVEVRVKVLGRRVNMVFKHNYLDDEIF
jgi:hypothetical protein